MNRSASVVILEDDDAHRDLVAHLLGITLPNATVIPLGPEDGECLAVLAPFGALVLVDRRLGARDSLDLVAPLTAARPDLEVVVMSAFVTPEDRVDCHAAGAARTFQKPGDLSGWRSVLMSLVDTEESLPRAA